MINSNSIHFNVSNSIIMSPKLQQAIKILQYNNLELSEFIKSESEQNPFIKIIEKKQIFKNYKSNSNIVDKKLLIENSPYYESIYSKIERQIERIFDSRVLKKIAFLLLDYLDENGFIDESSNVIAESTGYSYEIIESVIKKLQKHISPTGLFARNIKECLLIKLSEKYSDNIPSNIISIIQNIKHINNKSIEKFISSLKIDKSSIINSIKELLSIGFYPDIHQPTETEIRIPDVYILKTNNDTWKIELNHETLPSIVINEDYRSIIKKKKSNTEEKNFYRQNINSANSILKAINQRANTILSITKEILNQQREFFEKGYEFLTPMNLKDIADEIHLHESTVSRAISNKYIMTDFGIIEFKYFFSSKTEDEYGNAFSSNVIKEKIKTLIKHEDKTTPYSDEVIASLLSEIGISIARRTVAKYRESINIPTSTKRKKNKILYKI